jgi:transcriptional regulator with XRE-family HTH domain
MKFGEKVRQLRKAKGMTLREVAPLVGVGFHYLSKVENEKLDFGQFPGEALIRKLAEVLGGDESDLLLLAQKVPDPIRQRVLERPEVFTALAYCDDELLDKVMGTISGQVKLKPRRSKK